MATIGFVGLGAMGLPMARNLLKAGHTVRGFDMRSGAVDQLVVGRRHRRLLLGRGVARGGAS